MNIDYNMTCTSYFTSGLTTGYRIIFLICLVTLILKFTVAGGRSRLHLLDLGSCERSKSSGGLTLSGLGNVLLAIFNGQKHLPHRYVCNNPEKIVFIYYYYYYNGYDGYIQTVLLLLYLKS